MDAAQNSRRPAFFCALILLVAALATFPFVETGIDDDWSYVLSVRILAHTGHIVYNGWATAMLGWQLYLGALFVKLFGPSYTSIRASTLLVALITAFLTHRTFVRAGVNSRNATVATLALVLSPVFLPLAVTFMSDIGGLFFVVLCLYACLRALQSEDNHAVFAWLACAGLSNAVGGTVRQIAWLGVLVMFPCAVWLLHRRPHVLPIGALLYLISIVFVFGSLHWFHLQPYAGPEPLNLAVANTRYLPHLAVQMLSLFLSAALFLLPVLIAFVPAVPLRNPRATAVLGFGALFFIAAACFLVAFHPSSTASLIAPFHGTAITRFGLAITFPIKGFGPIALTPLPRLLITFVVLMALLSFVAVLFTRRPIPQVDQTPVSPSIAFQSLLVLIVPFVLAYLVLLLPRGIHGGFVFDRYLLLLLPAGLILLLRILQLRVQPNLPRLSSAFVLLFALYAVAGTHDLFSMYRARLAAIDELRAAGIPDNAIDAAFEHNAVAQINSTGYIVNPNSLLDTPEKQTPLPAFPIACQPDQPWLVPALVPGYALSYDPNACGGPSRFAPVTYREWLLARTIPVYIVNTAKP